MKKYGRLLMISGPTAVGKTSLALKLAKQFNGELISADSRQVYKGMDIGTGKDLPVKVKSQSASWRTKVKSSNHLILKYIVNGVNLWGYDVVEPNEDWSVAHFVKLANKLISKIQRRGKLPILVGGTGLYVSSLINPPKTLGVRPDRTLRRRLSLLGIDELQKKLMKTDPTRFKRMNQSDRKNSRRLIRAIEVTRKKPKLLAQPLLLPDLHIFHIGLFASASELDSRIEFRVRNRIRAGAEEEVKQLVQAYSWNSVLSQTIGYKEWKPYLEGHSSKKETIAQWITHEKQYARRQLTWLKKFVPIRVDVTSPTYAATVVSQIRRWYHQPHAAV